MAGVANGLSFDVEDYFQVSNFETFFPPSQWDSIPCRVEIGCRKILRCLESSKTKATFFVLGWLAEKLPALVKEIHAAGHEIASHGCTHRLIYAQGPKAFREDLKKSKAVLEEITGEAVLGFRGASFSIVSDSLWALDILLEEGFLYDSSIFPVRHHRYGIPGANPRIHLIREKDGKRLYELPPLTLSILQRNFPLGGGFYFRFFPLALIHWGIRKRNARGDAAVIYLHPWEFDPDQPLVKADWLSRFRQYTNLHGTEKKLAKMVNRFSFVPLRELVK